MAKVHDLLPIECFLSASFSFVAAPPAVRPQRRMRYLLGVSG